MAFKIGENLFQSGSLLVTREFHKIFKTNQVDVSRFDESLLLWKARGCNKDPLFIVYHSPRDKINCKNLERLCFMDTLQLAKWAYKTL